MPQSLALTTPPSGSVKRQRSQEIHVDAPGPTPVEQGPINSSSERSGDVPKLMAVKIPSYLNKSRQKISAAFHELEWKQRYRLQHAAQNPQTSPFRLDRSLAVITRNRYGNVQPWDALRVKLNKPIGGSDYVNASPIILKSRALKSKPRSGNSTPASTDQSSKSNAAGIESKYIATQGPKEGQLSHFWHMALQETVGDVGVIIMLTQHFEGSKEKCAQYYPASLDNPTLVLPAHEHDIEDENVDLDDDDGDPFLDFPTASADTDGVGTDTESEQTKQSPEPNDEVKELPEAQEQSGSVTLLSLHYDAKIGCEVRKLNLVIDDQSKEFYHYFFNGWPDFAKPEAEDRAALLELTKVSKTTAGDSPRIVHCSAGVGRTGTWIALDFLLQELEAGRLLDTSQQAGTPPPSSTASANYAGTWGKSGPPKASTPDPKDDDDLIWETVDALREQRMMMVMNELQYSFLYEALKEAFVGKYAEKATGPLVIEVQGPSPKVARKKSPFRGMFRGSRVGTVKADEDTVSSEIEMESEAETEIIEKGGMDVEVEVDAKAEELRENASNAEEDDPYAAVAPETIRKGLDEVHEHEVQ